MVGKKQTAIFMAFLAILALLPGCARKQHVGQQPKKLVSLWSGTENTVTKNGVSVKAKKFTEKDFDAVFDGRGKKMLFKTKNKLQPIQFSVKNESASTWMLTQNSIDLKLITNPKAIESYFTKYKTGWVILAGIVASFSILYGIPLFIGAVTGFAKMGPVIIGLFVAAGAAGAMLVLTPVVGVYQFKADKTLNEKVLNSLEQKQLTQSIILEPGQSIDALIFVKKKDVKEQFDITLFDAENVQNELVLKVDLSKNLNS